MEGGGQEGPLVSRDPFAERLLALDVLRITRPDRNAVLEEAAWWRSWANVWGCIGDLVRVTIGKVVERSAKERRG